MRASASLFAATGVNRPSSTAAAIDAVTRPWVRILRRRYARRVGMSRTSPTGDRFLDTARVHVPASRQPRVGQCQ